jgi:hypothetical protein
MAESFKRYDLFNARMMINYAVNQLKVFWRQPVWLLVSVLLAWPVMMLIQLTALKTDLLSANFISANPNKTVSAVLLTDNDKSQALPLLLSQDMQQALNITISYERNFSAVVKLADNFIETQISAFSGGFAAFAMSPILGDLSAFSPQLISTGQVAVLSYQGWQQLFAADPQIIGRWITINGQNYQVIAVLDKSFSGFRQLISTDIIVPFAEHHLGENDVLPDTLSYILQNNLTASELLAFNRKMKADFLLTDSQQIAVSNAIGISDAEFKLLEQRISLLQWLVSLLLVFCLIAYSGILISQQQKRHNEYHLRLLLGATKRDLQIQRWIELLMLSGLFMLLVGLLSPLQQYLLSYLFPDLAIRQLNIHLIHLLPVLFVAIAILIIGLAVYALQDLTMQTSLGRGQTQSFWQKTLAIVLLSIQLSLASFSSYVTLTLFMQQLSLYRVDLGFQTDKLYILSFDSIQQAGGEVYNSSLPALLHQLDRTNPEQDIAAAIVTPLASTYMFSHWTTSEGRSVGNVNGGGTYNNRISSNYFQVMQTPLLLGRLFNANSNDEIVVNDSLWQRYFAQSSLLTARLLHNDKSYKIVGVVADIRYQGPDQPSEPIVYQPLANLFEFTQLLIRSSTLTDNWLASLLTTVQQQHPLLSIEPISLMSQRVQQEHAARISLLVLMLILSVVSVIAAALFAYASIRQLLAAASTELALRFSMGARLTQLLAKPLLALFILQAIQLIIIHQLLAPHLKLTTNLMAFSLLAIVFIISVLLVALLMLQQFNFILRNSWQYLTK